MITLSICLLSASLSVASSDMQENIINKTEMSLSEQQGTYEIGLMVQELQQALIMRDDNALKTINLYGTDSRYYSMVRGWLFQELVGVESRLYASKDEQTINKIQSHSNFLKTAIKSIDLE